MPYERELHAALEAARRAGALILEHYERFEKVPDARADISTIADRESQEKILKYLHETFPSDALCAEEATPSLEGVAPTGLRLWVVDPIDGTRGFAKKNGEFSVMVAFVESGTVAVGVVHEPVLGRVTYAVRGAGCWRRDGDETQPSPCRVSATTALGSATLIQSHSRSPKEPSWPAKALRPAQVVETYSAGVKLARVARGEADLYVNTYPSFHDWDICAGHVLVEEAGGRVTGLAGEELCYGLPGAIQCRGLLGTNGVLHDAALKRLKR
ncbi:MAG: inositol monophosphatase [Planctomycetes bacterium]|nr:inositol monophosphatase [Planctomycetota bacterium]